MPLRLIFTVGVLLLFADAVAAAEADALYEKSVRPLLESKCFECHSSRSSELKGNLKLDSPEGIFQGGDNGPAVVAGDVANSFLLRAIRYQEDDYQMPPSGRLADGDIRLIEAWVKLLEADGKQRNSTGH